MPLAETWRDQYDRMLRSHAALIAAAGPSNIGSHGARDALYHFFQDACHLKDWIKHSPTSRPHVAKAGAVVEDLFDSDKGLPHMQVAADLCNGIKHLVRDRPPKTGDQTTDIIGQDVTINALPVFATAFVYSGTPAEPPPQPEVVTAEHKWRVTSNNQTRDALDLAGDVVAEWERWLTTKKLLP